jgi:peptidoglycan/xylan/chitin deacetylase (PgdA/CDA1 family)
MNKGPGTLCISIDLELAWGIWDSPSPEYLKKCLGLERQIVNRLLRTFARYEISATWAIVGHLLEKSSTTSLTEAPAWFAPDLVDSIVATSPKQEIASHSYGHIYFNDCSRDVILADLLAARAVHQNHGLDFTSFVFPRNQVSHIDLLVQAGIKVFRSVDWGWHMTASRWNSHLGRVANLVDKMVPLAPPVVRPIVHSGGIVELPSSMLLMGRNGIRRLIQPAVLEYKCRKGLQAAARDNGVFHLWFHPSNFYYEMESQLSIVENVIREAAVLRDQGRLNILPMRSFWNA